MNIVDRIKELQKQKDGKISLDALEKTVGLGKSTISNWKNSYPSVDKLQKIADYFGVSVDYLLGRSDNPSPVGEIFAASSKDEDFYGNLSEEGRRELDEYKQYLLQKYGKK
nr:helix-turn-helix domain-containing protein [uncultured Christensenella sp.]